VIDRSVMMRLTLGDRIRLPCSAISDDVHHVTSHDMGAIAFVVGMKNAREQEGDIASVAAGIARTSNTDAYRIGFAALMAKSIGGISPPMAALQFVFASIVHTSFVNTALVWRFIAEAFVLILVVLFNPLTGPSRIGRQARGARSRGG
jgi:hypothetical protein